MKKLDFQRIAVWDSSVEGDVVIDFPTELQWKMKIDQIRFTALPESPAWTDQIGYIKIYSEASQFVGNVIVNGPIKIRDHALPVLYPDQIARTSVLGLFRGVSNSGPVGFRFGILNGSKQKVDMEKIIIVFTITAEDGKL